MFDEKNQPVDIFAEVDKDAPAIPRQPVMTNEPVERHGPSRLLLLAVVLFVLGLGGGGYYLFVLKKAPEQTTQIPNVNEVGGVDTNVPVTGTTPDPSVNGEVNAVVPVNIPEPIINTSPQPTEPVQPPEPVQAPTDSDNDGLSDEEEIALGTNPQAADTDSDGLSDRDEVRIYGTDPKNPDTDGDTFQDGEEVRGGYDPRGPGRLFGAPQ